MKDAGVGSGSLLSRFVIWGAVAIQLLLGLFFGSRVFCRPLCGHFGEALDYGFDATLTCLGCACLLESLYNHSPRGRRGAIEFGSGAWTKLQDAREIRWKWLLVRFPRSFERDFDCVTSIELGGTEHAHLQNESTLRASRG